MAMVHELIGIEDNKVDLKHLGKSPKDQQDNFGDQLGMNIKKMVDEFQQDGCIAKIMLLYFLQDVAKFVDNYPDLPLPLAAAAALAASRANRLQSRFHGWLASGGVREHAAGKWEVMADDGAGTARQWWEQSAWQVLGRRGGGRADLALPREWDHRRKGKNAGGQSSAAGGRGTRVCAGGGGERWGPKTCGGERWGGKT
ncbi:hypothetical protein Scep_020035 [Stephania cephalantha]|uniref:Uncharacterized protein n=1 Tax=Stephania cephalantha TaxID=152367 RepID=A0AAP0ICW8_9MAGN